MCAKWDGITADTEDRYVVGPGALFKNFEDWDNKGTLVGATSGGNTVDLGIEFYETDLDGAYGPVKGSKKINRIEPTIEINLIEHTDVNWLDAIAGAESEELTPKYTLDDVGEGDGSEQTFSLPSISTEGVLFEDTLKVYLDGELQTRGAAEDYTYDDENQEITFNSAPDSDVTINAQYTYDSSGSDGDFSKITLGEITDSDFMNLALIGELQNPDYDRDIVFFLKNALAENFSMDLSGEPEEESTLPITFTGHFDPSENMTVENAPVEIWFPTS